MNRMYTKNDQEILRFYQTPKCLVENKLYKDLSLGAKMMYSVLRDRQDLSIENDWLDSNDFIYFYYDCEKLADLLNISTSTVNRYKKELIKHKLLLQKRQGQGKPNRMYILKPVDVENALISQNDTSKVVNMTYLEVSKSLANDTKSNETNKNDTERLHHTDSMTSALLNSLNEYSLVKFGKPIRKHDPNKYYDLDYLENSIEDLGYEPVFDELVKVYDNANLDYLQSVQERIK